MKQSLDFLKKAVTLTHVLVTVAVPIFLFIIGGRWLTQRFSLPRWCMAVFILLGVAGSVWSLWKWLRPFLREEKDKPGPSAFNDHF